MTDDCVHVSTKTVSCDGNGSHEGLGHPKVYLSLKKEGRVDCPYCGRVYIFESGSKTKLSEEH